MEEQTVAKLKKAAREVDASNVAQRALLFLARDPHGIARCAAPSLIASALSISINEAHQAITELLAKYLIIENAGPSPRLDVDFARVGIERNDVIALKLRSAAFVNHGAAHSDEAMKSLEALFESTPDPIYLGLEVTSPTVFKGLESRAQRGRKTVFLMPRKKHVPHERQAHYNEMKMAWVELFERAEPALRKNTELRITDVPYPDLYTSAYSTDVARFNVRYLLSQTTRDGEMLEVKRDTSLFRAISARYNDALSRSIPLWNIWWGKAILSYGRRWLLFPLALLVAGILASKIFGAFGTIVSTVLLSIFANIATPLLRREQ